MKIAVYAIALDEQQFVQKWYDSAKDADYLLICDTGSSDDTVALAEGLGITVTHVDVNPWRFDHARNAALYNVPADADLCIALDMDEVLVEGWREHLETAWAMGFTRPRYRYTWSWNEDGTPGLVYGGDKIHSRHDHYWKHPVHEVLVPITTEQQGWCGLEIHHHPDPTKSRSQYLPLLELAVQEDPEDDRNSHYLAREYFFDGQMQKAEDEFQRHLQLPTATWKAERAASMRYLYKITGHVSWLHRAVAEAPDRREAMVELGQHFYNREQWMDAIAWLVAALSIKDRPLEYLTEAFAWGPLPHDLLAISCFKVGLFNEAVAQGQKAIELGGGEDRLANNMAFYLEAAQ